LEEQISFLGSSSMEHDSIQTPSNTTSLFAQLSDLGSDLGPPPQQPAGEEEADDLGAAMEEELAAGVAEEGGQEGAGGQQERGGGQGKEGPTFVRPWQAEKGVKPKKPIKLLKRRPHKGAITPHTVGLSSLEEEDEGVSDDEMRQRASLRLLRIQALEATVEELSKELRDTPVQDAAREYYHMTMTAINLQAP